MQIAEIYSSICKFSDITVCNHTATGKTNDAHIVIMTIGGLKNALNARSGKFDISNLRVLVIDEVDYFFSQKEHIDLFMQFNEKYFSKNEKL